MIFFRGRFRLTAKFFSGGAAQFGIGVAFLALWF